MTKVQKISKQVWWLLLLLAVACTPGAAQPGESDSSILTQLLGTNWDLMAWEGMTILPEAMPTLSFEAEGMGGTTGCNHYFAKAVFDGSQVTVGEVEMTEMFCEGVMEQESAFVNALQTAESITLEGETLTILTAEGELTFQTPQAATLTDTAWVLSGIAQNDAVMNSAVDSQITAEFKDGMMGGSSGCNSYSATYEADGSKLNLGPAIGTLMACADEEINQRESEFLTALARVVRYEIQRDTLSLMDADGNLVMTFQVQTDG